MRAAANRIVLTAAALAALADVVGGCEQRLDVGSDVLWTAEFETNDLSEWLNAPGGSVTVLPAQNAAEVSPERVHRGGFAARLTIDASAGAGQQTISLSRKGDLPAEGYYSAWYYLPQTTTVAVYWVVFKIRRRDVADDATTEHELFDVDLVSMPTGEMGLQLYDHRVAATVPLLRPDAVVPVGVWFQLEAFYRNAADATGHFTLWLDGVEIADLGGSATSQAPWVEWAVVSVGDSLDPSTAVVYVDDCAVSRSRVGPNGVIDPTLSTSSTLSTSP
jgi:hypothetical protein